MKLIRGSYAYIIGLFILGVNMIVSIAAFIFALFTHDDIQNPLLSAYGSNVAGGLFMLITSSLFAAWTGVCSLIVLVSALRKNSIDRPLRFISATLFLYAGITIFASIFYRPDESVLLTILRAAKCVPATLLGVCLLGLSAGNPKCKRPTMALCVLCGVLCFIGYGFYKPFVYAGTPERAAVNGYVSLLLFSAALFLFFIGLCFFAAGLEKREKKKTFLPPDGEAKDA